MDIPPIEQMPNLSERLGESGMDKIRYTGKHNPKRLRHSTNIANTVIQQMQFFRPNAWCCPVNDLIIGAAHLDGHQSKPLNINRLFNILQCMEVINRREIITMTNLEPRQAQKYLRAIKFIIPHLQSHFAATTDLSQPQHFSY